METELGVFRAALIVWVSGAFVSAALGAFVSSLAWTLLSGSRVNGDHRWGLFAAIVAAHALLGAVGVTFGVGFFGFRVCVWALTTKSRRTRRTATNGHAESG